VVKVRKGGPGGLAIGEERQLLPGALCPEAKISEAISQNAVASAAPLLELFHTGSGLTVLCRLRRNRDTELAGDRTKVPGPFAAMAEGDFIIE